MWAALYLLIAAGCYEAGLGLWNSLHGPGAWAANPWVAAYSFRPHLGNIDQMEAEHD